MDAIQRDWRTAPLARISERAARLCEHACKLTQEPSSIRAADIARLREAGCTDEAVADLTQVVSLFAYFNRLADGLGIDPEPDW